LLNVAVRYPNQFVIPAGTVCPGKAGLPIGFAAFGAGPVATKPVVVQFSPKLKMYFGEARTEGRRAVKEIKEIQAERIVSCELNQCDTARLFILVLQFAELEIYAPICQCA